MWDRYVYPGTNVLRNKHDIMSSHMLEQVERAMSFYRLSKLKLEGITGNFDAAHLKSIHKSLFGDLYDWAGEFRDISIYKGGTEFVLPGDIGPSLERLCRSVRDSGFFRGLSRHDTASCLAETLAGLNMIHPFRKGNGRAQRVFVEQLALSAGYELAFHGVSENDMRDASRVAARGDCRLMRYLIDTGLSEIHGF